MKKLTTIFAMLSCTIALAQVTNEGKPASWDIDIEKSLTYIDLPEIDLAQIVAEDIVRDELQGVPYRIGVPIDVLLSSQTSGIWTVLENGDRIWRLALHSKGAIQMSVNFDQFKLPIGGKLYLYDESRSDLLGAYTSVQNQESGVLGTWFVKGDKLCIEYYEPKEKIGQGELSVENIIHCYRVADKHQLEHQQKNLNDSGDCNHDVDCPIGSDWEVHKEINKRSVAFLNMNNGYICSGTLINNAEFDYTPYFLTANHCYDGSNPASWAMRFNWISPNPSCGTTTGSTNSSFNTISGSTLRAKNAATDFCLVEINSVPPSVWNLTWAGWDKTDIAPDFVVGIHHPSGDIMKICRDDSGVVKRVNAGAQTWEITAAGGGWELGVTEGGSSGSALYDQDGRIVGQLYGGLAACNGTNDNGQKDYYGRLGISWNGANASVRLKDWLDPLNSNPDYIDSYSATADVDEFLSNTIDIFPNPTSGIINVQIENSSSEFSFYLFNSIGQKVHNGEILNSNATIDMRNLEDGLYFIKLSEKNTQKYILKKIVLRK